jgi:hypothetical protein
MALLSHIASVLYVSGTHSLYLHDSVSQTYYPRVGIRKKSKLNWKMQNQSKIGRALCLIFNFNL